jgi:hypothetical protein
VYALEDDTDNPRLFNYNKSPSPPFAWQSWGSINIAGARDISEPTDGRGLYTAGTNGFMAVSWPNTSGFFMPPGGMYIAPYGSNLIQTNDLRIWFSTGQQGLAYIDFPLGNIVTVADRLSGPSEGPWFEKSGDGDRLIISMAQSGQQYPALLMNMTDYVLQQAPAVEIDNSLIGGTVSDDGSRSITYWGRVRDAAFLPIGVTEPEVNNWVAVASTISRDGRRAYTFAFDFADFNRTQTISQPRIYVFDITTPVAADARFPKLGYFTLPDYPKCFGESLDCRGALQIKISPDNQTLFVAGSQNLIIAPIPAENLLTPASPPAGKQARPKGATQPWHVDTTKH